MPRHLTDGEQWAVINALRCAADTYLGDANTQHNALPEGEARDRIVRGFNDQATSALALAERFEDATVITVEA